MDLTSKRLLHPGPLWVNYQVKAGFLEKMRSWEEFEEGKGKEGGHCIIERGEQNNNDGALVSVPPIRTLGGGAF